MNESLIYKIGLFFRWLYYFPVMPWFVKILFRLFNKAPEKNNIKLKEAKEILIIKVDELGDGILITPFLRELRRASSQAKISIIIRPENFNLFKDCPYIDNIYLFSTKFSLLTRVYQQYKRLSTLFKEMDKKSFQIVIVPRNSKDEVSYFLTSFLYTETVIGYNLKDGYEKIYRQLIPKYETKHEVIENLELLKNYGAEIKTDELEVWLNEEEVYYAQNLFEKSKLKDKAVIALAPGARKEFRMWPTNKYFDLVNKLIVLNPDSRFILLGSKGEKHLAEYFTSKEEVIDLLGKTTINEAISLLRKCKLFIGNDSGLLHLAAAGNIPVIEISSFPRTGPIDHNNSPFRFEPWCKEKIVLQPDTALKPCKKYCTVSRPHCIDQISVEEVYNSAIKLLKNIKN